MVYRHVKSFMSWYSVHAVDKTLVKLGKSCQGRAVLCGHLLRRQYFASRYSSVGRPRSEHLPICRSICNSHVKYSVHRR
jgi:hypothetical protein